MNSTAEARMIPAAPHAAEAARLVIAAAATATSPTITETAPRASAPRTIPSIKSARLDGQAGGGGASDLAPMARTTPQSASTSDATPAGAHPRPLRRDADSIALIQ